MHGFSTNIEKTTKDNTDFRRVLYTSTHIQLVLMSIPEGGEIGNEIHPDNDQFIRVEEGSAKAVLNNGETIHELATDFAIVIPAGTWHNIINTGTGDLKLYTLYGPPHHEDGIVHRTKKDQTEEEFHGKTSE